MIDRDRSSFSDNLKKQDLKNEQMLEGLHGEAQICWRWVRNI